MNFDQIRRVLIQIKVLTIRSGWKKADYFRKHKIFKKVGKQVYYTSNLLPAEPFLVSIGDNVVISAGVRLITHSAVHSVFNKEEGVKEYLCRYGSIDIGNNVYIGADAIINFNVKIGNNCIVAAGTVVTKDVPEGSVVAGVPAKVIGSYEDTKKKALEFSKKFGDVGKDRTVAHMVEIAGEYPERD
jgi:acetyltransferase-like isoleucine patch superfamily enzyme